ncbi:MAG TPA: porin [Burkholderiales bacterium]|nr:porin [Burkholderiales bacterium]
MKLNRTAVAVALAMAGGSAFAQQSTPVTAETFVQIYGHLDLSIDTITKGIAGKTNAGGATATGKLGYQDDISSNLSYVGIRGGKDVAPGLRAVFQFETQIDVSATPGPSLSSSSQDNQVKGALSSRNSFLGLAGGWGAFKLGKTDAPYKLSTARMDPFSATIGDYNSIMGNTGGDNRAEFDTRISHAVWYESPNMGGFRVNALYAPGQNRSSDNSTVASGEPSCTGGNTPSPNDPSGVCTDGSFGNAYSIAGIYEAGPLYLTAAYEKHKGVNRTGDEAPPFPAAGAVGVVDENAYKAGVQYRLPTNTTLNAIVERMTRNAPDSRANERQRSGYWLAVTQQITSRDDVNVGWAHAGKTPGDPGVGPVDNAANMFALGYKHHFDRQSNWYAVYAHQGNHSGAHYDLGASGHGITTDCHDAAGSCFPGGKLAGFSVGLQYNF